MGITMNKIIPGLYIGSYRDAQDVKQLKNNGITHILSAYESAREIVDGMKYLCIRISDSPEVDISRHFAATNEFIHRARRIENGTVCVHCLAGVSRSVTITTAYIMTVCDLGWRDALNAIRASRRQADPNEGFLRQLANFERDGLAAERARLRSLFGDVPLDPDGADRRECQRLLEYFEGLLKSVGPSAALYTDYVSYEDRQAVKTDRPASIEYSPNRLQAAESGSDVPPKSKCESTVSVCTNNLQMQSAQTTLLRSGHAENENETDQADSCPIDGELKTASNSEHADNSRSTAGSLLTENQTTAACSISSDINSDKATHVKSSTQVHQTSVLSTATYVDTKLCPLLTSQDLAAVALPDSKHLPSEPPKLVAMAVTNARTSSLKDIADHADDDTAPVKPITQPLM